MAEESGQRSGPPHLAGKSDPGQLAFWLVLALAAAALVAPWWGHVDDTDAQLYQFVARGMAARHSWLDPRYLPRIYPHFREHLPFGLWPFVAAIRLAGERALAPLAALETLTALALTGWLGRKLAGPWAGALAMAVLATNESFVLYGGRPRLDPLLVLLATAAAVPVLLGRPSARGWLLAAGLAALAALVKGPFGVVPLAAATLARAILDRSPRALIAGATASVAALLPAAGFLLAERWWGDGTWWTGYVVKQLVSSALGVRHDGHLAWTFPLTDLGRRFWPGLALLPLGIAQALRRRSPPSAEVEAARLLALTAVAQVALLTLPGRKVWNHELVAYPLLALVGGVGVGPWLAARSRPAQARVALGAAVLAGACWGAALSGIGRRWDKPACVVAAEFAPELARLPPGTEVPVVSRPTDWHLIAQLAEERSLAAYPSATVTALAAVPAGDRLAIASGSVSGLPAGWHLVARARGYALLARSPAR